jgi:PAS domain S-box-containing protein
MDNLFQMLAHAADGAFVIDKNQRIIYWNKTAQEILGYSSDEVVGRTCHEVMGGCNDQDQLVCRHRCLVATTALAGKGVTNYDICVRIKSGQTCWLNISILTFSSGDDDHAVVVHLFRNVTEKKQNEQLIRQIVNATRQLHDEAPSSVFSSTPAKNSSLKELTNREREVLFLLAQGVSTQDIAHSLSISSYTVRNHVQNILYKLNVHSRLEAVTYALEHGLTSSSE